LGGESMGWKVRKVVSSNWVELSGGQSASGEINHTPIFAGILHWYLSVEKIFQPPADEELEDLPLQEPHSLTHFT